MFDEYLPVDEYYLGRILASAHAFVFQPEIEVRLPWHVNGPPGSSMRLDSWRRSRGRQMPGRNFVFAVLVLVLAACGDEQRRFDPPLDVYVTPEAVLTSFGSLSDPTGAEVMASINAAAFSKSGRYLAVADGSPPHLRILDRVSGTARSFGSEGEGPGELRAADAVEFMGDSVLLVLSRNQRLERYSVQGDWLGGDDLRGAELLMSSLTAGCEDALYLYGVPVEYRQLDSVPWIHGLRFEPEVSTRPLLWIPGTKFHFGWGGLYGLDGSREGVLLWYRAQTPHVGFWLPCDDDSTRIWSRWSPDEIEVESGLESSEGVSGQALTLPDTLFAGAAARGETKIWARRPRDAQGGIHVTYFRVVLEEVCRAVGLLGEWTLHDVGRDGLLLESHESFPSLSVLAWTWFERRLTRVECER